MAINFKGEGLKTKRIISSDVNSPLKIYSSNIEGSQDDGTVLDVNLLNNVGDDVFLFISGSTNSKNISGRGVSLFGGDVVVSGTLYAERQVIEVDENVPGKLLVSGSLYVTGSSLFNINNDQNSNFTIKSSGKDYALNINSQNDTIQIMSGGNSLSPNESEYTDTNFFVSGSIGSAQQPKLGQIGNGERGTGVFGGDLFVSGSIWANGVNLTNINNNGQLLSLKGYVENGDFDPSRSIVTGDDSIALGYNHQLESNNSFILGSYDNRIYNSNNFYNTIIGSSNSEISGSTGALIVGGFNNIISDDASPSGLILSDNATINRIELFGIYANNLIASGSGQENLVFGSENKLEGNNIHRADNNMLFGKNNKIVESNRIVSYNFSNSDKYNTGTGKKPESIVSGSNNTFLISEGDTHISGSESNFLYLDSSEISKTKNSFINAKLSNITEVTSSLIFTENSKIENSNNLVALSSINSNFKDDTINYLENKSNELGLIDHIFETGFNSVLGSGYSNISGSYNSLVGGLKNSVTGSTSAILGSIYSNINGNNSVILGGINNSSSGNENTIIGNENTNNSNNSFIIGRNITNNNDNQIIFGDGEDSNINFILSGSKFEFGDLTKDKLYGQDTSFFVSGSIGARERFLNGESDLQYIYGVSVFGGDLHVSGNLSGGNFELDNVFFDGGDSKGRDRSLGNNDLQDLRLLTGGENRILLKSTGEVNIGGFESVGGNSNTQLHIRTGSIGSYQFDSSLDMSPRKDFPLHISRNFQQQVNEQNPIEEKEVGLAFSVFPTLQADILNSDDEPGAAITHKVKGRNSKGDLLFKTKTTESQISLLEPGSLTTKLTLTSEGELLLGNNNPQGHYIDLRVIDSDWPLIQASGSTSSGRIISIGENKDDTKGLNQTDTIFNVYGLPGSKENLKTNRLVSSFGGDVVISGSLYVEQNIDLTGSLKIEGDIVSKDANLTITASNDIQLHANNDVFVSNDLVVENNITGSNIKGDGLEISNVNKSSVFKEEPDGSLTFIDAIDGNTGLFTIDLGATLNQINNGLNASVIYYPTNNTRLYDTYYEIEKNTIGQVLKVNSSGVVSPVPITVERVESPDHMVISVK